MPKRPLPLPTQQDPEVRRDGLACHVGSRLPDHCESPPRVALDREVCGGAAPQVTAAECLRVAAERSVAARAPTRSTRSACPSGCSRTCRRGSRSAAQNAASNSLVSSAAYETRHRWSGGIGGARARDDGPVERRTPSRVRAAPNAEPANTPPSAGGGVRRVVGGGDRDNATRARARTHLELGLIALGLALLRLDACEQLVLERRARLRLALGRCARPESLAQEARVVAVRHLRASGAWAAAPRRAAWRARRARRPSAVPPLRPRRPRWSPLSRRAAAGIGGCE